MIKNVKKIRRLIDSDHGVAGVIVAILMIGLIHLVYQLRITARPMYLKETY